MKVIKKLDSGKSSARGRGVKPTAMQRKLKYRKLLIQPLINQSKNQ